MDVNIPTGQARLQVNFKADSLILGTAASLRHISSQFAWPILVLFLLGPRFEIKLSYLTALASFPAIFFGLYLRIWARGQVSPTRYFMDGPYRYVRNPVELGSLLAFSGFGGYLGLNPLYLTLCLGFALTYLSFLGLFQDRFHYAEFGSRYLRYAQRVGRWLPVRVPGVNRSDDGFSLSRGISCEWDGLVWLCGYALVFSLRNHFKI